MHTSKHGRWAQNTYTASYTFSQWYMLVVNCRSGTSITIFGLHFAHKYFMGMVIVGKQKGLHG